MLDTAFLKHSLTDNDRAESLSKDPRAFRSAQLAERGSYIEAAELAQTLLEEGSHDIRIICHYLLGLFGERGVAAMADVVPRLNKLLAEEFELLRPSNKRTRAVDSALSGLFRTVNQTCMFHAAQDDSTWKSWLESVDGALVEGLRSAGYDLGTALERMFESPQSLAQVVRFRRFLKESLGPAVRRRERARTTAQAAEETPVSALEQAAPTDAADAVDGSVSAGSPAVQPAAARPVANSGNGHLHSPALQLLMRKLEGFERLMAKDDTAKAAVVAHDIQTIIRDFDPVLYLPHLFADFFERLSTSIDELMPYWHENDSPTWQALEHFYRADLGRFVGE